MKSVFSRLIISIFVLNFSFFNFALAQTTTTAPSNESTIDSLATTTEITSTDLGVENPSAWAFFKRKFLRLFSFDQINKLRFNTELADLTLLKARTVSRQGNTAQAQNLLDQYNSQLQTISTQVKQLIDQYKGSSNTSLNSLFDSLGEKEVLQISLLDEMTAKATGQFNKKLTETRLQTLKKMVQVLEKRDLTAEQAQVKLGEITQKLEAKESKLENKLQKKLALLDEVGGNTEDKNLDQASEGGMEEAIDEVKNLDEKGLGEFVKDIPGSIEKHLLILQELLTRVPESAKSGIQKAIDDATELLEKKIKGNPGEGEKLFKVNEKMKEAKEKTLERLKEKAAEETKKSLEKQEEEFKKIGEGDKKQEEQKKNEQESSAPRETSTSIPGVSEGKKEETSSQSGTSPTGASEIQTKEITIEAKNLEFKEKNFTVPRGAKVTIRFRNKDTVAHNLTLSNGMKTANISGDSEATLTYTADSTVTFQCTLHPSMGQGTISAS